VWRYVFWRSGARAGDVACVFDAGFAGCGGHFDDVSPAVAEVVFVDDAERRVIGNGEVGEAHAACLEGLAVGPTVLVEIGRAVGQAADVELVRVAIGPAERRLQHLMMLGEIEVDGKFERAGNRRLDANHGFQRGRRGSPVSQFCQTCSAARTFTLSDDSALTGRHDGCRFLYWRSMASAVANPPWHMSTHCALTRRVLLHAELHW
jgi:hypothetical protein